jgi:hypothetical protein
MIERLTLPARTFVIVLTVILTALVLGKSFYFARKNGGTDLRARIVGTRLATTTDHSPYYHRWTPADGERLLDPNDDPAWVVNGNVVTPAVMYAIGPIAELPYKKIRLIWTLLQCAAAALSLFLLARRTPGSWWPPVIVVLLAVICSEAWIYHIERGQMYVFYAMGFAIIYWLYTAKWKWAGYIAGLVAGICVFFRPTMLIFFAGFLLQRKFRFLAGAFTGAVIGGLIFVLPHIENWKEYSNAMKEYSNAMMGKATIIDAKPEAMPALVEGTTNITQYDYFNGEGLQCLYVYLKKAGITINNTHASILLLLVALITGYFCWKNWRKNVSTDQLFLYGFLLYILAEIFAVTPRAGYNTIQWLFPLFIAWKYISADRILLPLFITGVLFYHHFPFSFPYQHDVGEMLFIIITGIVSIRLLPGQSTVNTGLDPV